MGSKSRAACGAGGSIKRQSKWEVDGQQQVVAAAAAAAAAASKKRFVGVRQRPSGRWVAEIKDTTQKIRLWLGTFDSAEEGAKAYDSAARALRGANTRTNFVTALSSCESTPASSGASSKATRLIRLRQIAAANAKLQTEAEKLGLLRHEPTCSTSNSVDEERHSQQQQQVSTPPSPPQLDPAPRRENAPLGIGDIISSSPLNTAAEAAASPAAEAAAAALATSAVSAFSCSSESSSLHSCASSSSGARSSSSDQVDACIPWSDYVLVDGLDHVLPSTSCEFDLDFSAEAMDRDSCCTSLLEDHTTTSCHLPRDTDAADFPNFNVAMSTSGTTSSDCMDHHRFDVDDEICSNDDPAIMWTSCRYNSPAARRCAPLT